MQVLRFGLLRPASAAVLLMALAPSFSHAGLTFYSSRLMFDAAAPGLSVEGFESANVASGTYAGESSPISATTNDSIFSTGSILPGLTISNLGAGNVPGLVVYGDDSIWFGTKCVGNNWFGDTLELSFGPGVNAVGTDLFAATSPGLTLAGDFQVDVYSGASLLGSRITSESRGGFGFTGVTSTTPITSIRLLYTTDDASTFVDNVAFGPVPEPSVFVAMAGGLWMLKRRRR